MTLSKVQTESGLITRPVTVFVTEQQVQDFAALKGISTEEARAHADLQRYAEQQFAFEFGGGF